MSYFEKYLKYKNKYLELKNIMKGGDNKLTSNIITINQQLEKIKILDPENDYNICFELIIKLGYSDYLKKNNTISNSRNKFDSFSKDGIIEYFKDTNNKYEGDNLFVEYDLNYFTFYTMYNNLELNIKLIYQVYKKYKNNEEQYKTSIISELKKYSNIINIYKENIENNQLNNNNIKNIKDAKNIITYNILERNINEKHIIDDIYLYNNTLYIFNKTITNFLNTLNFILNINTDLINLITNNQIQIKKKKNYKEYEIPLFYDDNDKKI